MKRAVMIGVALVALALGAAPARADRVVLQNDGWNDGDTAAFQGGFLTGEGAAVTLGPVTRAFQVTKVQFVFGGDTTQQTVTLEVYEETGVADPGVPLYTDDYQVTGADDALQEIDLSLFNIQVAAGGSIRVALVFQHDGAPSVAGDDDGSYTAAANWIYSPALGGWVQADSAGVQRDWIIRAEVETECAPSTDFDCGDGTCLPLDQQCDAVDDCADGSDEVGCVYCDAVTEHECGDRSCVSVDVLCDGTDDCADGSDELYCGDCDPSIEFECDNGLCISLADRCDGMDDCGDGSDEVNCGGCDPTTQIECGDGSCVNAEQLCDGVQDCNDGADEFPVNPVCPDPDDPGDDDDGGCSLSGSGGATPALPFVVLGLLLLGLLRRRR